MAAILRFYLFLLPLRSSALASVVWVVVAVSSPQLLVELKNCMMEYVNKTMNVDDEVVSETPHEMSESVETIRRETSYVWNSFTKIGMEKDGFEKATCNYCGREYVIGKNPKTKTNYGTSHLSRHISGCKSMANSESKDQHEKSSLRKVNQMTHRELLAQAIIKHDLAFSFVEYDLIRVWIDYVNPDIVMPSRNTIRELHLFNCPFVDEKWKLISKILNFSRLKPPHTGIELEAAIFDCLKQWGIKKKVFSITLDNAAANDNMQLILLNHLRLQNTLLCDGEYFHIHCSAHILNLIVQEGLKVAAEALYKIIESVKYVRGSDGRMIKFQDCVEQAGIDTSIGLRLDVSTRWNSTYLMLESALKYEKAFDILQVIDRNYKYCPSCEEWRRGDKICEFLEPFYETTNMISGSSYPTSNLYFVQVWKIECILNENLYNDDYTLSDMSLRMKEKFDKYWKEYSTVLAFGAILDPRLKLVSLDFCYTKIDPFTSQNKVKNIREKFEKLYEEYASNLKGSSASNSHSSINSNLLHKSSGESNRPKKSKLYISEFERFENESMFVGVASESAFSIDGRVLTKYRSSTLPENVQMLICTRNWLHGFLENPNDENDSNTSDHETTTSQANVHQEVEIED
ncbi:zinc finger BED domain-containing protein RICESLEEPER 2-like [Gastrolobium bilobum]|uniref:zinc finger BED domain-containing protein RICESLEEPER 2-like n=1 Tax=Gastrolobium bilobum TaxID=150636 RepID=UPI002AAF4F9A|nr:zinc finger BED domain-containing protein RICESLEEPER 2-like [Gastrolobium bilobum]